MDNIYVLKDRLLEALHMNNMNAAELAELTGIQKSSISRYLSGENIPRSSAINKMAEALGVTPSWLLGYDAPVYATYFPNKSPIEFNKLNRTNKARLLAYYQALLDSQEDKK